ncbi:MAG TPA: ATP-binding protein, partial [Rhodocyclaceae bacterium]|nr:ATP-binding protein [Rhodocyclaceae bacterium]
MVEQLARMLSVNGFMPHGYCISWSPPLVATYVVSDSLIFLSYFSMPFALGYFARRRVDFPYRNLLWMFAAFIMACGITHLMGAVVLWVPLYGLDALLKAITAGISVVTAFVLWPMIPRALQLPSPAQLRAANEELRREVAERRRTEAALIAAKEAAEAATRVKSEFLANMSHELRTPLNAIIGFSEVLKDGLVGELGTTQKEYVQDIFTSGQHLLFLINDILDLSKIEAGHMELDPETASVDALLRDSLAVVRARAAARQLELTLAAPSLGDAVLDTRKTRQILYNLLTNAVKFTAAGGRVSLQARLVERSDIEGWRAQGPTGMLLPLARGETEEFLELAVEDGGIGIEEPDLPRLFRAFSQLDSSLARENEGTGLGLALVKRLTQLHGGTVAVDSTPGRGSRFLVWLPWRPASGPAPAQQAATPAAAEEQAPVLVIEDDDDAAELIRLHLAPEGLRVIRAADAAEGLAALAAQPVSLVILDLLLPDMDGWDLLSRIKQPDQPWSGVPVVIASIVADAKKGFALGAAEVLHKPYAREDLRRALERIGLLPVHQPTTVLVVDDDPQAVELAALQLADMNITVLRAYGGREGVDLALRDLPDML